MTIDDPKIAKAVDLLRQHQAAVKACLDFLKEENEFAADPIALKLWIANRITGSIPLPADKPSVVCSP